MELDRRSAELASVIEGSQAKPHQRVAILADRSPLLVSAILAASRLGYTFIVLDSAYPDTRLGTLLSLACPDILVSAGGSALSERARSLAETFDIPVHDAATIGSNIAYGPRRDARHTDQQSCAYYLFTSGSTGKPKCVALPHGPLNHFIDWHVLHGGFQPTDRFSMTSGLSHDPLMRDIFTPLSIGACLVIPTQATITEPGRLRQWLKDEGVTVAHLTPAMGQLIVSAGAGAPPLEELRHVFWGGDQLREALVRSLGKCAPNVKQTNFYGCTETPQAICYFDIEDDCLPERLPIGRPVKGFDLIVIGDAGEALARGETGELRIRSRYLSLGYVCDGTVVPHAETGVYDTGDRARIEADGNIVLLGRADDQIKIRGYRVDLSEITQALLSLPGATSAIALPVGEGNQLRIIGFAAARTGANLASEDAIRTLASQLPSYMVPQKVMILDKGLPLLPNGKTDRQALIRLASEEPSGSAPDLATATPAERAVIEKWKEFFPDNAITPSTSFVSLGGDSLSYVQTYLATEEALGVVPTGWVDQSIAELAKAQKTTSRFWSSIDSTMVIRCVAILMIVGYHFGLCPPGDGLTGAFFLVSGYMLASLQLKEMLARGNSRPLLTSIRHIFVPAAFFTALTAIIDLFTHVKTPVNTLMFLADWTGGDPFNAAGQKIIRHDIVFWYVDCLLQMLIAIYGVMLLFEKVLKRRIGALSLSAGLFAAGLIGRFAVPLALSPHPMDPKIPDLSLFQLAPFSNIATFSLGMLVFSSEKALKTQWLVATILTYSVIDGWLFGAYNGASVAAAGLLLVFVQRIQVPRALAGVVFTISGASLYIYLTQFLFSGVADKVLKRPVAIVEVAVAIAGGILIQKGWQRASSAVSHMVNKIRLFASGTPAGS